MNTSHPIFTARPDTIPGWIVQVVRLVQQAALEQGTEFVMVGATARDILLESVFGLASGRGTADLDFGVLVESWEQFAALKSALVATGNFKTVDRQSQRLLYEGTVPVDLIPFGGIEEKGTIAWTPSREVLLNVSGFREALACAVHVQLDAELVVPVVSLPGLTVLKLLAWADRGQETNKDAEDLHQLLREYGNAGNEDRLFGAELHLLEDTKFDFELGGARLLGKDVASLVTTETSAKITDVLGSEKQLDRLLRNMLQGTAVVDERVPTRYAELLDAFRKGFFSG